MAGKHKEVTKRTNIVPFHPDVAGGAALLKTTEARTSRAKRIQLERDHLRLQIKTLWHMEQIYDLLDRDWAIPSQKEMDNAERAGVDISQRSRIQEYKAKMEGHFKMLNKVVPDIAAYQVDAQVETTDKSTTPNIRIVAFRDDPKQLQQRQGQIQPGQPPAEQHRAEQHRTEQHRTEQEVPQRGLQETQKKRKMEAEAKTIQDELGTPYSWLDLGAMPWLR